MRQTNVIKLDQRSQSFSSGCKSATDQNLSKSATGKQRYRSVSIAPLMSIYEEDVSNSSVIKSSCPVIAQYPPEKQNQQSEVRKITKKHSLPKTESRSNESVFNENRDDYEKRKTIIWPPLPKKSVVSIHRVPKSIVDPERIDEYRRQKEIELMAIRMNQEKYLNSLQKQIISAERQLCAVVLEESETDMDEIAEEYSNLSLADIGRTVGNISDRKTKLRSCRRRNIIERQKPVVRNEIINSEQLLLREKIDVDILKLRENFIQKPTARIEIQRTGKSWKPPPEPQYILPIMQPTTNSPGCSGAEENHEHEWRAAIYDPELKNEHESFTPPNSPDPFLIKGSGTGSLDKAARRQIKYLVKPTSNGAHRPKNLFGGPRSTPAGGFYPHAPNAVKVIRKTDGHGKTVFLKLENRKLLSGSGMNDMQRHTSPVHTSTISDRVMPRCVDIRKRCLAFEREAKKLSDAGPRIWKSSDCSRKNSSNSQNHVYDDIVKSRKPSNSCTNGNQPVAANRKSSYRAMSKPPKNDDLDELARLNERLSKRSKARCTDYKLVNPTIIKTSPEPVSKHIKESIREVLESRTSNDNSYHSTSQQNDRSGYLTDASSATWQFSTHSFSPRSVVSINGGTRTDNGLLKVRTDLSPSAMRSSTAAEMHTAQYQTQKQHWPYMPAHLGSAADSSQSTVTREFTENYSGHADRYASLPALDNGSSRGTLITIKDDKPRGIMKRKEMENKHEMMYSRQPSQWESKQVVQKPKVIETVQRFEEHKRTEEVERRIQRKEKKERSHKSSQRRVHHHSSGNRTGSASRHNGGSPARESYTRTYSSRRERDGKFPDGGRQYVSNGTADYDRYGSLSDSLRRGELKYNPNGEIREVYQSSRDGRVHRSYSTRDIFDTGNYDGYRSSPSYHRGNDPLVEYPPTLPRGDRCAPIPPPHRVNDSNFNDYYRPISKSRSYADWDEGRGFEHAIKRRDNDMARLENEFRDSLLMPMPKPGSAINEKEYRREQLPGGYESYDRQFKASSGQRLKRNGNPAQFNEASEEFNYTRETESDRRN